MTDEISVVNGKVEMMYVGEHPWHGLGTPLQAHATAQEAMEAAHLDWTVDKRKLFWKKGDGLLEPTSIVSSGFFATVRADTERPLGIVTNSYKVVQNVEAFDFMDALVGTDEAKYETCGALFKGRKIWMLAKLPETVEVADGDLLERYVLLVNTHDGSESIKVLITPVRVVCSNTLTMALQASEVQARIIHTGDVRNKVDEARRVLGITLKLFDKAEDAFRDMAALKINEDVAKEYFRELFETDTKYFDNVRDSLMKLYKEGPTSDIAAGTMWGAYNAVTDFVDHYRGHRKVKDRHFHSVMLGEGHGLKRTAFNSATSIVRASA